jgi:Flp pilus assembly protein TadD
MQREVLDIQRRVLGPVNPNTALSVYNLGCLAALQGRRNEAFSLLREAIDHGLRPADDLYLETDSSLKSLHGDPRFAALVADAKERAAAAQKPH